MRRHTAESGLEPYRGVRAAPSEQRGGTAGIIPLDGAAGPHSAARAGEQGVGFSLGPHYCLGAPLARMEAETAIRTLLQRAPALTSATDTLTYLPSLIHRGMTSFRSTFPDRAHLGHPGTEAVPLQYRSRSSTGPAPVPVPLQYRSRSSTVPG
nr:cytochrome P450 [Frankia sp. Cppng1_Ct_nod]